MKREGIRERVRTFVLSNDNRTKEKKLQAQMIEEKMAIQAVCMYLFTDHYHKQYWEKS
ncbi:hypothetical protein AAAC51_20065 [Priestia megaterium]